MVEVIGRVGLEKHLRVFVSIKREGEKIFGRLGCDYELYRWGNYRMIGMASDKCFSFYIYREGSENDITERNYIRNGELITIEKLIFKAGEKPEQYKVKLSEEKNPERALARIDAILDRKPSFLTASFFTCSRAARGCY